APPSSRRRSGLRSSRRDGAASSARRAEASAECLNTGGLNERKVPALPKRTDVRKILIIGSGPIVIGQAAEFDFSGSQAALALREEGYQIVIVNSNPATIQTDPEMADATYVEPLTVETLERILAKERPDGLLAGMG